MNKLSVTVMLSGVLLASLSFAADKPAFKADNPFAQPSTLVLQAPAFDRIHDADYLPALLEGIRQAQAEIEAIANDPAAPTFDNTIVALERSGRLLDRANSVFSAVAQANTNQVLDVVQAEIAPKLAELQDAIWLNEKLFVRVKSLYDQRDALTLSSEARRVLADYYRQFVHAGTGLGEADKNTLRELNKQLAMLKTEFQQKLLVSGQQGAFTTSKADDLAGLSKAEIATARKDADERHLDNQYLIPLQNTTQQAVLASLDNRKTREQILSNSLQRAQRGDANDTRSVILKLAQLRAQKALLLGYPNYAAYVLYDQMAQTPANAVSFLNRLTAPVAARIADEARQLQAAIERSGDKFELQAWDWQKYSAQVRKEKYDFDENELKPYFELNRVLVDGVFHAANRLYGLTFKERHDLPVYHPDVRVFDVIDQDGSQLGLFYADFFQRDNKTGGAWMSNFVGQSTLLGTKPVVYNVTNFTKPAAGEPVLLSFDDVITLFHEFGHALHGLFASQTYPLLSGTNTARDWVEFPSQFNEHWALHPDVLRHYAVHYQTGKVIPKALVDKVMRARNWGQGYDTGEILAAALLDLQWHQLPANAQVKDVDAFERQALAAAQVNFANVPPRYRSSYFLHIWANGYAAGYYAYQWTQMLSDDAYAWFTEHGGLTRANGQRFRDLILSRGNTDDYKAMYLRFAGREPKIEPMLENRGLR